MPEHDSLFTGHTPSLDESRLIASIEASADVADGSPNAKTAAHPEESPPGSLTSDMIALRQVLTSAHDSTVALLESRLEAVRRLETETTTLRRENCKLRTWIEETAGAGEKLACLTGGPLGGQKAGLAAKSLLEGGGNNPSSQLTLVSQPGLAPELEKAFMNSPPLPTATVFPLLPGTIAAKAEEPMVDVGIQVLRDAATEPPGEAPGAQPRTSNSQSPKAREPRVPLVLEVHRGSQRGQDAPFRSHSRQDARFTKNSLFSNGSARNRSQNAPHAKSPRFSNDSVVTSHVGFRKNLRESVRKSLRQMSPQSTKAMFTRTSSLFNRGAFIQTEDLKDRIRKAIFKQEASLESYYHEIGICQRLARSSCFDGVTLLMITLNAVWMAVDADLNDKAFIFESDLVFQVGENIFCTFFTLEIIVRFLAFKLPRDCFKDRWFAFDVGLSAIMIIETWLVTIVFAIAGPSLAGWNMGNTSILRILRLVRLMRMARMAKLVRIMPELMILIKGMLVATKTVFYTLFLLLLIIYIFAIAFMQLSKGTTLQATHFGSLFSTMKVLLLNCILPDQAPFMEELLQHHVLYFIVVLVYVLIGSLTVMNMLVGVLVEVVKTVSTIEKETMDVNFVKNHLMSYVEATDEDDDKLISKDEFEALLDIPEAAKALHNIGVDVVGLVDFMDYIFMEEMQMSSEHFMEAVLQFRGSNTATVKDIVNLRKFMAQGLCNIEANLRQAM